MINPKEIKVPFEKLTKVIHIADVHNRLFKRHKEYSQAFETLYDDLKKVVTDETVIFLGGDIHHAKIELSPELISLTSQFLSRIADIAPTIMIVGNHDMNMANRFRMDSLTPIVENLEHPNLFYLRDSGIYRIADTDFAVYSIIGDEEDWPTVKDCTAPHKIALCHAPVNNAVTDTGYTITRRHIDVSFFDGYDIVMLGDIHRHQVLQEYDADEGKPIVAYAGSLIQQNYGETLKGHGWLEWDVPSRTFAFHELANEYGYVTLYIENGKMPDLSQIPTNARVRAFVKDLDANKVKKLQAILSKRFNLKEFMVNKMRDAGLSLENQLSATHEIPDVHNLSVQNELISDYLLRYHSVVDDDLLQRIFKINKELNAAVTPEEFTRNVHWRPHRFEFSNMFSYGPDNVIDFDSMQGVYGLFAPNHTGKSAAFDALMFCLFDKTPRAFKGSHIINNRKNKFECRLDFEINGVPYVIHRVGKRKRNGEVKVDVDFWHVNENGDVVSLNGEDRRSTDAVIRRYVGSYEEFILTSLSTQHDNALFIEKGQADRKNLLAQFMGIDIFDMLYSLALDELKGSSGALKRLNRTNLTEDLAKAQDEIDSLNSQYDDTESIIVKREKDLSDVKKKLSQLYQSKVSLPYGDLDLDKLEESKGKITEKLDELSTAVLDFETAFKEATEASSSFSEQNTQYKREEVDKKWAHLSGCKTSISVLENSLSFKEELKDKYRAVVDHSLMHEFDPECEYCVKNNEKLAKELEEAQESLSTLDEECEEIVQTIKDYEKELEEFDAVEADYESMKEVKEKLLEADRELHRIQLKISETKSTITKKQNQLKDVETKIKQYHESVDIIEKNAKIDEEIDELEQRQQEIADEVKLYETKLRGLHGRVQVAKTQKTKILEQISEMEDIEESIHAYEYYIDAVKRDGIPYELIGKIIPSIESEVNNILSQITDFTVALELDGKNVNGRICYSDERQWPLEMSSGMERFISSLAIRVALTTVSNLPKPNFLVIDEGLGVLSTDNLMSMHMLFAILKDQFDFIVIISHLEAVRDMVDSLIEIQVNNGYSQINF